MKPMQTKNVLLDTPQNLCIFKMNDHPCKCTYNSRVT